jgi:hypothetical protein
MSCGVQSSVMVDLLYIPMGPINSVSDEISRNSTKQGGAPLLLNSWHIREMTLKQTACHTPLVNEKHLSWEHPCLTLALICPRSAWLTEISEALTYSVSYIALSNP